MLKPQFCESQCCICILINCTDFRAHIINFPLGSLSQMEQCQSILQAIDSTPFDLTCEAFGNCTGLSCQLQTFIADNGSTSFAVIQKCEDPVRVMVEINIDAGSAEVQQQYEVTTEQQNRTINTAIGTVSFTISRNDTQMNFMVCCVLNQSMYVFRHYYVTCI